jgi:hypothetical protein
MGKSTKGIQELHYLSALISAVEGIQSAPFLGPSFSTVAVEEHPAALECHQDLFHHQSLPEMLDYKLAWPEVASFACYQPSAEGQISLPLHGHQECSQKLHFQMIPSPMNQRISRHHPEQKHKRQKHMYTYTGCEG